MPIPFVSSPGVCQADIQAVLEGQQIHNIINFYKSGGNFTATDRTNLNTALVTFMTAHLLPQLCSDYIFNAVKLTNLETNTAPSSLFVLGTPLLGSIAGGSKGNESALVVTHRTAMRGRNYRGRTYVAGVPATGAGGVAYDSTRVSNIVTAFAWLMDVAHTATFVWSVLSKFLDKSARSSGHMEPITAVQADVYIDAQRRRLYGRGV